MYTYTEKTENKMEFEAKVMNAISSILDQDEPAEFSYGTLFVTCSEDKARYIFHTLCYNFGGVNRVHISKCGDEYAYDFVG